MIQLLRNTWNALRALSGDDAYERYLKHLRERHPEQTPHTRRSFYLERQRDKWQGVSRCC